MRIHLITPLPLLVAAGAIVLGSGACTVNTTSGPDDGGTPGANDGSVDTDSSTEVDSGAADSAVADTSAADTSVADGADGGVGEAGTPSPLPFAASNINWTGIDVSMVEDQDVSNACDIQTAMGAANDCFANKIADTVVTQADQSELHVIVVKSLKLEPTAIITISGGLPLAIVSLGDITIAASATIIVPPGGSGGFMAPNGTPMGGGPGGGAGGTTAAGTPGTGAGGGSFCGQGGQGAEEMTAAVMPGAKAASYGSPTLVPLQAGSSGGNGDTGGASGGGALELVAGGTFSMGAGCWINVGGAGGGPGGTTGQGANGAGSGGAILIEGLSVNIAGILAANGGGGGGGTGTTTNGGSDSAGANATPNATAAAGGTGAAGGVGSAGPTIDGATATAPTAEGSAGGGGGAAGRIRINSMSGAPNVTGATFSPDKTTTCTTVGTVTAK